MLILKHKVPPALILPEKVDDLQAHLRAQGAHWFTPLPEYVSVDADTPDAVVKLHSRTSDAVAEKTRPNKLNSKLLENGAVRFTENKHCGFMLENMEMDPKTWSCALRLHAPQASARTLFTLKPENTDNYYFLQQIMGEMIFKDQQAKAELKENAMGGDTPLLVVAGVSDSRLWLRLQKGDVVQSDPAEWVSDGPYSLYIGCRSNKARLLKTLGQFDLSDLVFWPDCNVLLPEHKMTIEALDDEALWRVAL